MVAWYCINSSCPAQLSRNIEHFVSRSAMDIVGLGGQIVQQLVDAELIKSAADLYSLEVSDLVGLEKFGPKKAQNVIDAIQASKNQSLARLITALGIRGVGEVAAEKLSKTYQNLDQFSKASPEELQQIEGIGEIVADDIVSWFREWDNQQLLQDFKKAGLWPESLRAEEKTNGSLTGLSFVITGTLPNLTREQAEDLIKEHGGKVLSSVSKKTSYLLLGENPGSKYTKALELGIPILDEASLKDLLQK